MNQRTQNGERNVLRTEHLTESEYHRLLAVEQRRTALAVLAESTAPVELVELATAVAERENEGADGAVVDRITISLHHVHLPKMAELGVIDYHPDATCIESLPQALDP